MANGKKFSTDFQQAQEIENTTQILIQSEGWPVQKATLEQIGEALIKGNIIPSFTGNYPKMSVGFAENIVGDGSATEEEFSFRPTAGVNRNTLNDGAARIHTLKGNSVVVNQELNSVWGVSQGTIISDGGAITLTATGSWPSIYNIAPFIKGHKYLAIVEIQVPTTDTVVIGTPVNNNAQYRQVVEANKKTIVNAFLDCTANYNEFYIYPNWNEPAQGGVYYISTPIRIDLTKEFGMGNEPTTIEEYYQRKPIGINEDEYNEGTLVNLVPKAIKTTGLNQFNGIYAKVLGGVQYYLGGNYTSVGFATEEGGVIEAITTPTSSEVVGGSAPADRLYTPSQNGYIYATGENICISLYWPTEYGNLYGTYKPYKPFERDLSWVAKYFPNGMRSAGSAHDEIRFNSTTQRWESVQRVGIRAYQSGDESNTGVTTDGTYTNYALATTIVTPITENVNFDYDVSDYGTEELIVAEGVESAPLSASIEYSPNVLAVLKNAPGIANDVDMLKSQLSALTAQLATLTLNNN